MNKGLIGALAVALITAMGWYWSQARISDDTALAAPPDATAPVAGAPMVEVVVPAALWVQAR